MINFRMSEVDDNLNYMLGQLSLVVTEFNQVKSCENLQFSTTDQKLNLKINFNSQVKNGLGEAMEGLGEDLLEEYKKSGDAKK